MRLWPENATASSMNLAQQSKMPTHWSRRCPIPSPRFRACSGTRLRKFAYRRSRQSRLCKPQAVSKPADLTQDVSDSLEKALEQHARRMLKAASKLGSSGRYLLAIAGGPGSGKTSSAYVTCQLLNRLSGDQSYAAVLPMDGYHYTRQELDQMEDPEEAHARRGAYWTFNADAFLQAIVSLRKSPTLKLPSFDHATGDPVEDDIEILPNHKVVIIEGNYVLLDKEPWRSIRDIVDETWFISCPVDTAMDRVLSRQLFNGSDLKTARWRVSNNDRPNAEFIEQSSKRATHIIPSMPYADESAH